jgi:hypothetical protein
LVKVDRPSKSLMLFSLRANVHRDSSPQPMQIQQRSLAWRLHQPDIWGLTKGMLQSIDILLFKTIPF